MSKRASDVIMNEKTSSLSRLGKLHARLIPIVKKCWMAMAILIIIMAIAFSIFRALTPWAKQYKGEVEHHLSTLLGQPVTINSMETTWYWLHPVLRLNQVTILDSQDHALKLNKLMIGINLFSSLWHWNIQPGILYVDDVHLTLRQVDNHWQIDGLRQDQKVTTLEMDDYLPILAWLLQQQKIIVKNVSAMVYLNDGTLLPLSAINLLAVNHNGHYRLKGEAKLAQTMSTELLVLADMKLNPSQPSKVSGHAYLSIKRLLPAQWQVFFPQDSYHINAGKGKIEAWIDVSKGQLSSIQSTLRFRHLVWNKYGNPQSQSIQTLRANLAWLPTVRGWQLSGDQIQLIANGKSWPENAFLLDKRRPQSYRIFVKNILLEPLLAADIDWPQVMQPILALHPQGSLQDTQIGITAGQADYILTRFNDLSWDNQENFPAFKDLSGVLNWQPTEGRLELDGENTVMMPHGLKPVTFTQANAAFEWKELSHGLRISMERLILSHPDFVLSARGALDEPFTPEARNLRLAAELSAHHVEQWLAYIPSQYLKPKLENWLKHDIKRIDKTSAQLVINGPLADFPFDKKPGEFSIASRLSGTDLLFNKKWPLINDIDAYLRVDKRALNVDVFNARLKNIEVSQANLRMDDMGLDKETLLIHGQADVLFSKLKNYIFSTPLSRHFSKLKKLNIKQPLNLDLSLEVPLYPENDDILARGAITFNNNRALFHHTFNDVQFTNLMGSLAFDEHGVTDSKLNARLMGDPVAMQVKSMRQAQPYTEIKIEGDTTIDIMREKFDLPIFAFMDGSLKIISTITLTDDPNDLDNMQINTSLSDVNIDLPKPLGKSFNEKADLAIKVDFNPEKAVRLRFNYDNRLSSDLWFASRKGVLEFDKGEVRIGNGHALWKKQPGLQVAGTLPVFDLQQWRKAWSKIPTHSSSPGLVNNIQSVDLKVGNVIAWGKHYPKVAIAANKLNKDVWSCKLDQEDAVGTFRYQHSSNTLSGHFTRLYLAKSDLSKDKNGINLKPNDIPNLDLTIDSFKWGAIDVGNIALKSTSKPATWHLDYCKIKAPGYLLSMTGDWKQSGLKNNTDVQATIQINDLAQSLKHWHITPAVDAHQGNIQFKGAWPGAVNEFALTKINGDMYIELKDGRITNLSRETEEKLGLGKLLSILSLQTIPRRLKLDFSDLSNAGYSFDIFKGNFALQNGVLNTNNSYIDGPVAYASMKGDLDVVKQLYDVELHISPHITASLPIVATIAGGPIAGVAAWVASKIINQGMQQVTGYTYKISGPWLDPIVQQVSIFKKVAVHQKRTLRE